MGRVKCRTSSSGHYGHEDAFDLERSTIAGMMGYYPSYAMQLSASGRRRKVLRPDPRIFVTQRREQAWYGGSVRKRRESLGVDKIAGKKSGTIAIL